MKAWTSTYLVSFRNARECYISSKDSIILEEDTKLNITLINSDSEFNTFYIAKQVEIVNKKLVIQEFTLNNTSLFIIPLIFKDKIEILWEYNFINAYVKDKTEKNKLGTKLYLVFRYMPFEYYYDYLEILKKFPNFLKIRKSSDGRFDIVIFDINTEEIRKAILKVIHGKYLKLTKLEKSKIIKFHAFKKDNLIRLMLLNDINLRLAYEEELNIKIPKTTACKSKPNIEEETCFL